MPDITSQLSPEMQATIERYMPYLEEIRKKMMVVVIVFGIVSLGTGIFYQAIFKYILSHFNLTGINMVLTSPSHVFELAVATGIFFGTVVTLPILTVFLLQFLKPALAPKEYRMITSLLPGSVVLFGIGFGFGIWVMQFIISMFAQSAAAMNTSNLWDVSVFFYQIIISGVLMGLLFQFPIILTILIRLKVIGTATLYRQRSIVYVIILLAAAIGPSTDVFSLILLTIPLLLLFEITLLLNRRQNSKRVASRRQAELDPAATPMLTEDQADAEAKG